MAVGFVVSVAYLLCFPSAGSVSGLTLEQFTNYIVSPPPIDTLVYKRRLPSQVVAFRDKKEAEKFLDAAKKDPKLMEAKDELFALRYDGRLKAFVFREIEQPSDPWNPMRARMPAFFGKMGTRHWVIHKIGVTFVDNEDGMFQDSSGKTNRFFYNNARMATEILRFGMFELIPESFRMVDGTKFQGLSECGRAISGTLVLEPSKTVKGVKYDVQGKTKREIVFRYSQTGSCQLPSRIEVYTVGPRRAADGTASPALYCTFEVLECVPGPQEPLPAAFLPDQFLMEKEPQFTFNEKGQPVLVQGTNQMVLKSSGHNGLRSGYRRVVVLLLLLAASAFFGLEVWRRLRNKHKKSTE